MYVLAGVRAGRGDAMLALSPRGLDPLTSGLLAFDCRRMESAIAAFSELPGDHPDRCFGLRWLPGGSQCTG
jgi:hypothetical protein